MAPVSISKKTSFDCLFKNSSTTRETMPCTASRALLLATALTVALVWTAELSELDSAAMYAGRRGGRLQTMGSFMVRSAANRYGLLVLREALNNGCSSSLNMNACLQVDGLQGWERRA